MGSPGPLSSPLTPPPAGGPPAPETRTALRRAAGLTPRAVGLGAALVVLVNLADPYSTYVLRSSLLASDYMPVGALFPFFLVVAGLNPLLKALRPRWALHPGELVVVFMMALVGSSLATYGLAGYLISVIASPYFFATPENQWAQYLHPHIPEWIVPGAGGQAMRWFFDGLPPGEPIPYLAWVAPLFWWLSLMAVVVFVAFCAMALLRRQWVENEKLLFPLVELPLTMVQGAERPERLPAFLQDRLFWAGFGVPLALVLWNCIHYFTPFVPQIPVGGWGIDKLKSVEIAPGFPTILVTVYPPIIGFAYLMNLEILFSFWFLHLLALVQAGVYTRTGFALGAAEHYSSEYDASMGWQSMGAFVAMVLWMLWVARSHLRAVLRKAWRGAADPLDDTQELLPYRTAVIGLVLGLVYVAAWLHSAGMAWHVLAVFLPTAFLIYLGTSRIVAEAGLAFARGPMVAQTFTAFALGSAAIPAQSMTALALSYAGFGEIKNSFMPAFAHCGKLSSALRAHRRAAAWAAAIAVLAGLAVAVPWTIHLGYTHGAYNFDTWIFSYGGKLPFEYTVQKMRNPIGFEWGRLVFFGIGGGVYSLLNLLRARLAWWPLHPIGLTLASSWPIKMSAFSLFLGWLAKWIIVRLGGVPAYRRARPLFLGLILGYFTGVAASNVIDFIWFEGQGHWLYGLY
ncbi:MAG: DUF6785 family protein [Candidatus Latescibacterota bacterium]